MRRLAAALALALSLPALALENPAARFRTMSEADCGSPADIIAEAATAPVNRTYLRVQHIGDPGTPEWTQEVANRITWAVGERTGYSPPALENAQRGYRDEPGYSAFQLGCDAAGFFMDSARFSHSVALVGEGPSASVVRDFSPPKYIFSDGSALAFEATIQVPWVAAETPPTADGTAQLSFFYYVRDDSSGVVFVHLLALFDNRPLGTGGSGYESVGSDGVVGFVSSPVAASDANGAPVQYVQPGPGSEVFHAATPWTGAATFRAIVTQERFEALLARLRAGPLPQISPRPANYRVLSFGVLGEIFPGTGSDHDVAIGASVSGMALRESFTSPKRPR